MVVRALVCVAEPMYKQFRNLTSVLGGEALLRIANLLAVLVIARLYGASILGIYAVALAYATAATMLADNGLQTSAVKKLSIRNDRSNSTVSGLLAAKTILSVPLLFAFLVISRWLKLSPTYWWIVVMITLRTVLQSYCQLLLAMMKAVDRMPLIVLIQGTHFTVLLIGIGAVYSRGLSVIVLMGVLLAGQIIEVCLSSVVLWRTGLRLCRVELRDCWVTMWDSTPIGITFSIVNLLMRLDLIILSALSAAATAGTFASAQIVLVMVYVVAWLLGSVLLPDMTRLKGSNSLASYVSTWSRNVSYVLVPAAVIGVWAGPRFMQLLYGSIFEAAGPLLSILILAAPFIFLNSIYLNYAIAMNLTKVYFHVYAAIAVFAILLDLTLIHFFSNRGLAAAVVIREILIFVLLKTLSDAAVSAEAPANSVA